MSGYGSKQPHLTRVDEPHFSFSLAAYSSKPKLRIKNFKDLKGLQISYRRGVKLVEDELFDSYDKKNLHSYPSALQALKLVFHKRVDLFIGVEFLADEVLKKHGSDFNNTIRKIKRLKSDSAHVFLIKKYSFLSPLISAELKKMKASGEYKKLVEIK